MWKKKLNATHELTSLDRKDGQVQTMDVDNDGQEVCSIKDSPFRILKVAAAGNLDEFRRIYKKHPERLNIEDSKGARAIHHAAGRNKVNIIEFILEHKEDINVIDSNGDTPLHWAAEKDRVKAIDFLIENGADTSILNYRNHSPLHVAVETSNVDSVEAFCKHPDVDIDVKGDLGQTPLHYCAIKDNILIATKLTEFKPRLCARDSNGLSPIHCAATNASAKVLKVLLDEVEKLGYTRDLVLNFVDKERNAAIHAAVNGGDRDAVKLCLENGARIDVQQTDHSTPVHLACSQGSLDMIKMMFSLQDKERTTLHVTDVEHMTPLHKAAMFDHPHVVDFLIAEGSDIDALDKNLRTPLLLATTRGGWKCVEVLLEKGANYRLRDNSKRNILHLAIICGGSMVYFGDTFFQLLNEKDIRGCTPLHYASREGNIKSLQGLLELGAKINAKNESKQSPLHFAARYGRFQTCRRLLDSSMGPHIINDTDGEGMTALHLAAYNGQVKVVRYLMRKGALLHRDHNGRTPLHLAAMGGYTNTMMLLLGTHAHLLDQVDDEGNTAIHLASKESHANAVTYLLNQEAQMITNKEQWGPLDFGIQMENKDVAMAFVMHDRWQEIMSIDTALGCPMLGLIEHLPEVASTVLDRCQTTSCLDSKSKHYSIQYVFQYLQSPIGTTRDGNPEEPLKALNTMVRFNRVNLLSHPVCLNYLGMKWSAYGRPFHLLNITVYLIFLAFLTYFVATTNPQVIGVNANGTIDYSGDIHASPDTFFTIDYLSLYVISIFAALNVVKEIGQMIQQKFRYFLDLTNLLEWAIYGTTLAFILPFLMGQSHHFQWDCGSVAVFFAWFNFLLYLQRFDIFGIYVVMFLEILKTLVQVLTVFSILIIAFGLSFYILMSQEENEANSTPWLSIYRMVIMMLGEIDYISSYIEPATDGKPETMHYRSLTFTMLFIFVLLMPILLMNLLIGLAVGDIAGVQRNAQLKRLAMQVELHTELEQKLPTRLIKMVDKDKLTVSPHCTQFIIFRLWSVISRTAGMDQEHQLEDNSTDPVYDCLHQELMKQKRRIKDVSSQLDKQYELLRLIVQKMEIRSEDDERDEGDAGCNPNNALYRTSPRMSNVVAQAVGISSATDKLKRLATKDLVGRKSDNGTGGH
ncbi:transient receptor potential cation channel subfamily A member 1-like [Glandiceps talaboti]